jgi:23S rRNA pseudouridine1911/1915/1917 synthase
MNSIKKITIDVADSENERIDSYLANHLKQNNITRSQIQTLIKSGKIKVNNKVISKPSYKLESEDLIECELLLEARPLEAYDYKLDIIDQDESFLVINKPANLSMHPGAGNQSKTLLNACLPYYKDDFGMFPNGTRPGIVHRLDKDTTGIVVVALTAEAHNKLAEQFSKRTVGRSYQALVGVTPRARRLVQREESGTIDTYIKRDPKDRKKQIVTADDGRRAVTNWKVVERFPYASLIELKLKTGRTHQIRVHMQHLGSPIIGDKTYGNTEFLPTELKRLAHSFGRQALHAFKLEFDHPKTGERKSYQAPLPKDMQKLVNEFRDYSE